MFTITTKVQIEKSVAEVWKALINFSEYPKWNPLIPCAEGHLNAGAMVNVTIAPPYLMKRVFAVKLLLVRENDELAWLGQTWWPNLLDGNHVFRLRKVGPSSTELEQSETFTGLFVPLVAPILFIGMRKGFKQMNNALKTYLERQ